MIDPTLDKPTEKPPVAIRPAWLVLGMATAIMVDLAFQRATGRRTPGLFVLPAVIGVAAAAGRTAGLWAAVVALGFAAVDLAAVGPLWSPPYDRGVRLGVLCVTIPGAAWVVGRLRVRVLLLTDEQLRRTVQVERDRAAAQGRAFASERDDLRHQRDLLVDTDRQSQRRLSDLIAAVPGIVWEADVAADGSLRPTFVSRYVEHLLGYDPAHWTESPGAWLSSVHPDDRAAVSQEVRRRCAAGARPAQGKLDGAPLELRCLARDGSVRWVEARIVETTAPGTSDRCVGLRGVTLDVTARHLLDQALRDRAFELAATAEQLRASNAELDQFAYVTSHDLKAPLRGIANLSNWIEEDLGPDRITQAAHAQFDLLRGRVHRMERLIDGLLEYSHVGRTAGRVEWVEVGPLLAEVIDWVGPPAGIRVIVGPAMPAFNTDRLRLSQVLANLIGNAVKHHGPGDGWVRVTCESVDSVGGAGDGYAFTVADDGPGIDPRFHERIFGIFQTLQRRDKVEGTGIGLALVRKVVAGKGGTVSVESTPGHGAVFRFTWPRVDPAQRSPLATAFPAPMRMGPTPPPPLRMQEIAS